MNRDLLERLWGKTIIDKKTGCWLWQGYLDKGGYGKIRVNGEQNKIHRLSYELFVGDIIEGVYHHCDTPNCWNPDHLFTGTAKDNVRDMDNKHRRVVSAKLTSSQVCSIRRLYNCVRKNGIKIFSQQELANHFGISRGSVSKIVLNNNWKIINNDIISCGKPRSGGSKGEYNCKAKLTRIKVDRIRRLYKSGYFTQNLLACYFNVTQGTIGKIVRNELWCD